MIYGFIGDEMFKSSATYEYGEELLPPVCYLDDTIENYLHHRLTVTDTRETRNVVGYTGKIRLYFDASKLDEEHFFTKVTDENRDILFSLIEKVYTSEGMTQVQLEDDLRTDPIFGLIYTQGTLRLGIVSVGTGLPTDHVGPKIMIDCIEFEVAFPEATEKFKLWMNRSKFASDYPLSTITRVILPCGEDVLLNPNKITNIVDALIQSTTTSFSTTDPEIKTGDHSGLLTYYTKYVVSSTTVKMMPFGVLYKGATPSSLEIRKAIRERILSYTLATQEIWENLLPDLFVTGQFFVVPLWDNTVVRPDRVMYPSILKIKNILDKLKTLYPVLDEEYITDYQELLSCAQSEIYLLTIPDPLNDTQFSILSMHPTYQLHSPQSGLHAYMENKTKEFSIKLNRCLAVLAGETILEEFIENTIDGRTYLSFVSSGVEYHVLSKEGYNQ